MPSIISFQSCIARPGSLLTDHLLAVKEAVEYFLKDDFDCVTVKLAGLAGLCHDLAKANADWQHYIRTPNIKKGPNHSACGAFLFSYLGYHLLRKLNYWEEKQREWLWLIHDIQNHHSMLGDLFNENWLTKYDWGKFDLEGMAQFIKDYYPELDDILLNERELIHWIEECRFHLEDVYDELGLEYEQWEPLPIMTELHKWRQLTTALISGDRFHVKKVETNWLKKKDFEKFLTHIEEFAKINHNHPLSITRIKAQQAVFSQLEQNPNSLFYSLNMPTGYGKTVTSLKMAAWFGKKQGYRKIVYVAPYLSILEQTTAVIEKLLSIKVLEHHSLAIVNDDPYQRVGFSQLAMESWANSVVCTSFHQFSKAIFPSRSQDVLRRAFLKDAVIIIDEPQIFNPDIWNLFLCGLEALAKFINLKVIFLSATMPPFQYGLKDVPYPLMVQGDKDYIRYSVQVTDEKYNEDTVVDLLKKDERETQAIILNTVKDAYLVFKNISQSVSKSYLVHGLMTPIHKKILIKNIRNELEKKSTNPLYVVSTQVLEAGVDVSFQHVARALPIFPSIVQSAGRVNRHMADNQLGLLTVFPFYRGNEKDTRSMIYPKTLQRITDRLIFSKKTFHELELAELVKVYYEEMFRQNSYETALVRIGDAYEGNWHRLSEISPFKEQYFTLPLFIPFEPEQSDLLESVSLLKKHFKVKSPFEIYEKYDDYKFMSTLSFEERKQFMILFNYYVLNVSVDTALKVVSKEDYLEKRVPILLDTDAYDGTLGLKVGVEDDQFIW
ncbi:CRISPR-associated helicase Cas3' [Fervidibacillus halotolerans]|uniref:CRISPR-associated helicase Cas3 n=1 Tax=Fervidibacillus halotolerans TaxID=2980027 RepID=A0A9E8RY92_9BACI|nr:CRISPR-associated helicase Cas3' [Fervidibacillus halotolerans]WAA11988.1 CRISPR-associated helicase Cas3' [Fervidibacillus halotolerans]